MPVSTSAKKALRVADRRHSENLIRKGAYKRAVKATRKAIDAGAEAATELFQKSQSALDRAAGSKAIHPNKAARLKSRLAKKMAVVAATPAAEAKPAKSTVKKAAVKKTGVKKAATKKTTAKKSPAKK